MDQIKGRSPAWQRILACAASSPAAFAAVAACFILTPDTAHGQPVPAWEQTYERALDAIRAGRLAEAITLLEAVRSQNEYHAGALLDLADLYCKAGDRFKAEEQLVVLEAKFDPPPRIREEIERIRENPCRPPDQPTWAIGAAVGYETNVNQGASIKRLLLAGEVAPIEVLLSDEFRPQASSMVGVSGFLKQPLEAGGNLYGTFSLRRYPSAASYDTAHLGAGYERAFASGQWEGVADFSVGLTTLDGRAYHESLSAQLRLVPPEAWRADLPVGLEATTAWSHYPSRPEFDDLESTLVVPLAARLSDDIDVRMSAGWLYNQAQDDRPGGDRRGPLLGFEASWKRAEGVRVYAGWQRRILRGSTAYAPPLLPMVRRQTQDLGVAALEKREGKNTSLRVEYRYTRSADTVPIYSFDDHSITLYWIVERR